MLKELYIRYTREENTMISLFNSKSKKNPQKPVEGKQKRKSLITIKNKLIVSFALILTAPTLVLAWSSYEMAKNKMDQRIIQGANENVRLLNEIFSEFISGKEQEVELLSQTIVASEIQSAAGSNLGMNPATRAQLDAYNQVHPEVEQVNVGTDKGVFMTAPKQMKIPVDYDPRQRPWYQEAMENKGTTIITSPYVSKSTGELVVTIARTTKDGHGVAAVNVNVKKLADVAKSVKIGNEGYVYILDKNYKFVLHPTKEAGSDAPKNIQNDNLYKSEHGYFEYLHEGKDLKKMAFVTNRETGWKIAGTMYSSEVDVEASAILDKTLLVLISSLVIGGVVVAVIIRSIVNPLRQMTKAADKISKGDLSEQINFRRADELGVLAESFNGMATSLREVLGKVNDNASQLSASAEELSASAEQSAESSEQVAQSIQEVAVGAERQLGSVEETARAMESVSTQVKQIAENAEWVTQSVAQASHKAQEGNVSIQRAIDQMNSVNGKVVQLAGAVKGLGERSTEIGNIIEVITSISTQTNLLALNAAIEAARAGEHGRGFAVVAEEVRKLAEQSNASAQQITQLIASIQEETQTTVVTMDDVTDEVKNGIQVVNTAGVSFEEILASIEASAVQIKEVSATTHQIAQQAQKVTSHMESVAAISEQSASGVQNVAAVTEEQLASMQEISASAASLTKMAEDLQVIIGAFKV